jgi:Cdc6-like AAA superfamily ATPase
MPPTHVLKAVEMLGVAIPLLLYLQWKHPYLLLVPLAALSITSLLEADAIVVKEFREGKVRYTLGLYNFRESRKANENVLIIGTPGKGKTNVMDLLISKYYDRFIVFNFKRGIFT